MQFDLVPTAAARFNGEKLVFGDIRFLESLTLLDEYFTKVTFAGPTATRTPLILVLNVPFGFCTFIERLFRGEKFEAEVEPSSL